MRNFKRSLSWLQPDRSWLKIATFSNRSSSCQCFEVQFTPEVQRDRKLQQQQVFKRTEVLQDKRKPQRLQVFRRTDLQKQPGVVRSFLFLYFLFFLKDGTITCKALVAQVFKDFCFFQSFNNRRDSWAATDKNGWNLHKISVLKMNEKKNQNHYGDN